MPNFEGRTVVDASQVDNWRGFLSRCDILSPACHEQLEAGSAAMAFYANHHRLPQLVERRACRLSILQLDPSR
jgi:hypothetical protein